MKIRNNIASTFLRFYNPQIFRHYAELIGTDFASLDQLHSLQAIKLKDLLVHAKKYSSYYADCLRNIDESDFRTENLSTLPIVTKPFLKENRSLFLNNPCQEKLINSETSGSTGSPFVFARNKQWDAATRAAYLRGYSWYHVDGSEKSLYFWGFDPNFMKALKIRIVDSLLNRKRIFSFAGRHIKEAEAYLRGCTYIQGYSSGIYNLARYFEEKGVVFTNIKFVKGTSEKIYDEYSRATNAVFGRKMISEYGAAESGIIAFECPAGNMHICMENVIIEEVDSRILVTNLHSHVFPIIRYDLGDYIELDKETICPCGRKHQIIKEIIGRIGSKIIGFGNQYPSLTLYYIFKNISLATKKEFPYFAEQKEKGELVINVLSTQSGGDRSELFRLIRKETDKYFGVDMHLTINLLGNADFGISKKTDFKSSLSDSL